MNQNQKIIEHLVKHAGVWIPRVYLSKIAKCNESEIDRSIGQLRIRGHNVETRVNPISEGRECRVTGKVVQV
jgi:hypothetical protein